MYKQGLANIFFSVHHVNIVWKFEVLEVGKILEACLVSPGVFRIISLEIPGTFWIRLERVQLCQDLFARHRRCCQVFDSFAFDEVLLVFSERMLRRQKLSMQVKAGILATRLQPMKRKSILACWACKPSMNTHAREKRIRRQVMHRVLVPDMHCEGL